MGQLGQCSRSWLQAGSVNFDGSRALAIRLLLRLPSFVWTGYLTGLQCKELRYPVQTRFSSVVKQWRGK